MGCGFGPCNRYRMGVFARMAESHRSWLSNNWMGHGGTLDPCGLVQGYNFPSTPVNFSFAQYNASFGCDASAVPASATQTLPQVEYAQPAMPVVTNQQNLPAVQYAQPSYGQPVEIEPQPVHVVEPTYGTPVQTYNATPVSSSGSSDLFYHDHDVSLPQQRSVTPEATTPETTMPEPKTDVDLPSPKETLDDELEKINI